MSIENKCLIIVIIMWVLGMFLGTCAIKNYDEAEKLKKENEKLKKESETLKINYNDCIMDFRQETEHANTLR